MTVKELIKALQGMPQDAEVYSISSECPTGVTLEENGGDYYVVIE